jgi:hypothetical protein
MRIYREGKIHSVLILEHRCFLFSVYNLIVEIEAIISVHYGLRFQYCATSRVGLDARRRVRSGKEGKTIRGLST